MAYDEPVGKIVTGTVEKSVMYVQKNAGVVGNIPQVGLLLKLEGGSKIYEMIYDPRAMGGAFPPTVQKGQNVELRTDSYKGANKISGIRILDETWKNELFSSESAVIERDDTKSFYSSRSLKEMLDQVD